VDEPGLRIAFVSMHTSPTASPGAGDAGGMNVVELALAEALARGGHSVDLMTRRADPDVPDVSDVGDRIRVRLLPAGPPTQLAKSAIDEHIPEFRQGLEELDGYDVVHSHHWMSGVAAIDWAHSLGVPHVQSFHSVAAPPNRPLADGEPPESPDRVAGEARVARRSDAIAAISVAEARTVVERCGADPERVHVISPGVDLDLFHPLGEDEEPWSPEPPVDGRGYVVFAARLQPLKGPDLALRALAHVEKWLRPRLVVAGDYSEDFADYRRSLTELVARLGLDDDVTYVGPLERPELARVVRGARLVLVPSHSETFGLIALEAAASGVPVVASAAGGLREAVAHGETGQRMDSREPEEWGKAMTMLLAPGGPVDRMAIASRIHARRFEWDWSARRLAALYTGLREAR
jgi:D-inositol-3-phosphate glycosyltransferase